MIEEILPLIVQAGAVGLCAFILYLGDKRDKRNTETHRAEKDKLVVLLTNHMEHLDATMSKVATQIELSNSNYTNIKGVLSNNARVIGQAYEIIGKTTLILEKLEKKL